MPLALITGASTGIGRASALRLAADGWTVLAGVRASEAGEELIRRAASPRVIPVTLDVTDAAQVAGAAGAVARSAGASSAGGLDALVNNAGIGVGGPLELVTQHDLQRQFEVNVFGQVSVIQAMLPALRRSRGRIILVSSIGGRVAMAYTAPYAASKHALEAIGDCLRVELADSGVTVAIIEPGAVATPIWAKNRADAERLVIPAELSGDFGHVPAALERVLERTSRRGGPPEQGADTIAGALAAPRMRARYLVGRDARAMLLARRILPDHLFDRFARRALGV